MNLLADLARLLRLVDPMPARVIPDAEAAGVLLRRPAPRAADATGRTNATGSPRGVDLLVVLLDTVPAVRSAGRRVRLGTPGGEAVLEVEIRHVGAGLRIAGLAPVGARLEVRWAAGGIEATVDGAGYFNTEAPAGPVRFQLRRPDRRASATGWL
ncbi:hypothetical protein [Actinophytocola sp.]|uniref:hypothetical protein n=1 Tax=Actinophytocola sp. TaxID=1872138 RepID=UPI003D6A8B2D